MRIVAALVALFLALAATPAFAQDGDSEIVFDLFDVDSEPLGSKAMRSDLRASGYRNGRLPDHLLTEVDAGANERCFLEEDAAAAWELLVLAAEQDGVTGFAAGWCYRSLRQQELTYNRNCPWVQDPAPPVEEGEEPLPPPPPYRVCRVPTAVPGTSNHGWGRAIDVVDTTASKAHILSCGDPQYVWLVENGSRFGWVLPPWARCGSRSQEPWHYEWAGVSVTISELIIAERVARGGEMPR